MQTKKKTERPKLLVDGREVVLTRRRYGSTTFCWVSVHVSDGVENMPSGREFKFPIFHDCGDPFQCVTPKRSDIERVAREELARFAASKATNEVVSSND